MLLDGADQIGHGRVVLHLERVVPEGMERVQLGELQIDDLALLHRAWRGRRRCRSLLLRGSSGGNASALICGSFFAAASGHFVSRFGRRGLVRGRLVSLGWAAPAGRRRLRVLVLGHSLFLRGTAPAGLGLLGFRLGFFLFAAFSRWFRRRFLFHLFTGGIAALLQ